MDAGDASEQQDEEIESLQYIYEEGQFEVVDKNPYRLQIDVSEEDEDGRSMACRMLVTLPPEYPAVAPDLEVSRIDGVTKDQCEAIKQHVMDQIEDYLDMPMIFSLSTAAKEWIQENAAAISEEHALANKQGGFETHTDHPDEDMEVVLKRKGTPVTPESFAQWNKAFQEEMDALKQAEEKKKQKKLTGRQMFETGAASNASDGSNAVGEADVDMSAARQAGEEEAASGEVELDGIDMSVWANEDIDLDEEDFGEDEDEDD